MVGTKYCKRCGNSIGQYDRCIQECSKCGLKFGPDNPTTRPINPDREIYSE